MIRTSTHLASRASVKSASPARPAPSRTPSGTPRAVACDGFRSESTISLCLHNNQTKADSWVVGANTATLRTSHRLYPGNDILTRWAVADKRIVVVME